MESGALKPENDLLKRELHDMKRSKEAMVFEHGGLKKDREILRLKGVVKEYKRLENKSFPTYRKQVDDPVFIKNVTIVHKMNARFDKDLMKYLFSIWRLKFMLKRTIRLKSTDSPLIFIDSYFHRRKNGHQFQEWKH